MAVNEREQRFMVMEGDMVAMKRLVTEREVKAEDFLNELHRAVPINTGILPYGCVWMMRRNNNTLFLIERPPALTAMQWRFLNEGDSGWDSKDPSKNVKSLLLSWAYTIWAMPFKGAALCNPYMVFSYNSIAEKSLQTPIYASLLPNIYDGGHGNMCLGNDLSLPTDATPTTRVNLIIKHVMNSNWNRDLLVAMNAKTHGISGLEDWHAKSAGNADFYKSIRFPEHRNKTLQGLIQIIFGSEFIPLEEDN